MNTTAATILKLLFQSPMTDEEISEYIKIEKAGIYKNICLINDLLEKNNFKKIEKTQKEYKVLLTSSEREKFYDKIEFLSLDEKIDYLYIKFLHIGILNLEEEKKILDVSRSTITRTFKEVKEIFDGNGSKIEYLHGKGMKLVKISELEKREFCVKIMKFLMMEGFYSNPLKSLIEEITSIKIEERFRKINEIFKKNEILFNFPSFFFCYALEIGAYKFGKFRLFENNLNFVPCKLIENESAFSLEYKNMLNDLIYRLKIKEDWAEKETILKVKKLYEKIKEKIDIDYIDPKTKEMLIYNIYLGLFKREKNILKIKKVNMKETDQFLTNEIDILIKDLGIELYQSDMLILTQIIKKIIIENKLEKINVLILINELTINHYFKLLHDLKKRYPMVNLKIDAFYFYKLNGIQNFTDYHLVIGEDELEIKNFKRTNINLFSLNEIQDVLDNFAIEKTFFNFKRKNK